ncbi:MAG: ComEC/Rec2 family competence protein [Segetibacter sp.]
MVFSGKLISVTIAAQILTLPIILHTFHQFPNFFLIANCITVPLSTVILFAEFALLAVSFVPVIAKIVGFITSALLAFMNNFIEWVSHFPFAVYLGVQNNLAQTVLLYVFIIGLCYWLLNKTKPAFFVGIGAMLIFL